MQIVDFLSVVMDFCEVLLALICITEFYFCVWIFD